MKLSIVIPAYNEEEAIGETIRRTLSARSDICGESPIEDVEVIVVSDGSTDRTADIARTFEDVQLIAFEKNRGYGAAIKKGFRASAGDVVGFLDADGTCDPRFFGRLCTELISRNASVAIGSRMGPQSRMPRIRRLGNRIYALILSCLSNQVVTDTASGMRVIRRDALRRLYPLPDGLHFTPAMSARILMDDSLTIVESPMSYEERVGESKLNVLRDGVRFLRTILEMAIRWQPARMFLTASIVCCLIMVALALHPTETWLRHGRLHEGMIYRLLLCCLLGAMSLTLLSAGAISRQLDSIWKSRGRPTFASVVLERLFSFRAFAVLSAAGAPVLLWLVGPGIWTRLFDGQIDLHWSRVVLAGLVVFGLGQILITALIANLIRFHLERAADAQPVGQIVSQSRWPGPVRDSPRTVSTTHANETAAS